MLQYPRFFSLALLSLQNPKSPAKYLEQTQKLS